MRKRASTSDEVKTAAEEESRLERKGSKDFVTPAPLNRLTKEARIVCVRPRFLLPLFSFSRIYHILRGKTKDRSRLKKNYRPISKTLLRMKNKTMNSLPLKEKFIYPNSIVST